MNASILVKYSNIIRQRLPALIAIALGIAGSAKGATVYWDGLGAAVGTSTNWGSAANWSTVSSATTPDPANPPGASDDVIFNITTSNALSFINLNADQSVNSMTFNSSGGVQMV